MTQGMKDVYQSINRLFSALITRKTREDASETTSKTYYVDYTNGPRNGCNGAHYSSTE